MKYALNVSGAVLLVGAAGGSDTGEPLGMVLLRVMIAAVFFLIASAVKKKRLPKESQKQTYYIKEFKKSQGGGSE